MTAELFERLPLQVNDILWHPTFKNEFLRGDVHTLGKHSVHTSFSSITERGNNNIKEGQRKQEGGTTKGKSRMEIVTVHLFSALRVTQMTNDIT